MEQLHGDFAAYLFKTVIAESKLSPDQTEGIHQDILKVLHEIVAHEDAVIDYTFSGDIAINDITSSQLKLFIRSRANDVLELLGFEHIFTIEANPIGDWFYRGSKSIKTHDFFAGITNQYRRSWKLDSFSRLPHLNQGGE